MQSPLVTVFTTALAAFAILASAKDSQPINPVHDRPATPTITRDVVIIGGGTTGSFAASWLKDNGYSYVLVEKRGNLGGHSQTYISPSTGHAIEYGNVFFEDTDTMRKYLNRYHVPFKQVPPVNDPNHAIQFYNLRTGKQANFQPPNPVIVEDALDRWTSFLAKHFSFLEDGYYLPDPVPADLLLPFNKFVEKYDLNDMLNIAFQVGQGFGDFLSVPTLYAAKILSRSLIQQFKSQSMLVTQNNGKLYERAKAEFAREESLLLSSTVVHVDRSVNDDGYMSVLVQTKKGGDTATTRVRARQLLVTIPPKEALGSEFSLEEKEKTLFSKFACNYYWAGVLRNAQLPALEIQNCDPGNPGGVPTLPGMYVFEATASPEIHTFWYGAPTGAANQTEEGVKADVLATIQRLRGANGASQQDIEIAESEIEFLALGDFNPFACMVDATSIEGGFYRHLYNLQGFKNTWWTGAAWHTHDASLLLDFTQEVLKNMTRSLTEDSKRKESEEL
ncbi:Beta-cyclopiazonate dehydrogenase 3 [Colletotrichum truncatum]|uniref:Beta-cyclopiazonate dehydrogenase 3 n=1 Tax=Colletotrichum truncatum TaxID=5467 RepID=A0ACC3Z2U6_COLTU|nr:Beta-cyclopiazonate dehydrogenase 3 [Colletotrichum truncatum]KAF6793280.1 Beta-cyclopiazonate dehydrogenase 3 [Colletotrichum truncatum]